ncbi:MAG: UDP-N-acetylmuramate dehydrogenase [Desulfobaccales bacterium]
MLSSQVIKDYTTFKIGGPARHFSICQSIDDLLEALYWCKDHGLPWFILGNGSNILVSDDGFPGLVIRLGGEFNNVVFQGDAVEAGAGVLLPALSRHFLTQGWGGFEFMCDIPGTIGGAVRINAGTKEAEIKDHFVSARVLSADGTVRNIAKDDMNFSHRHSCLAHSRDIVLSARFSRPYMEEKKRIQEKIKQIIADRRQKQPKNRHNCGSVFKNPLGGKPAGWYIDQTGLKGLRIGDAMVAHEHANWIVNLGKARAEHVKELIEKIQEEVFQKFCVKLEREVIYVPEDILGA